MPLNYLISLQQGRIIQQAKSSGIIISGNSLAIQVRKSRNSKMDIQIYISVGNSKKFRRKLQLCGIKCSWPGISKLFESFHKMSVYHKLLLFIRCMVQMLLHVFRVRIEFTRWQNTLQFGWSVKQMQILHQTLLSSGNSTRRLTLSTYWLAPFCLF